MYATTVFSVRIGIFKVEIINFIFFRKIYELFAEFHGWRVSVRVFGSDFFDFLQIIFRDNFEIVE